MIATTLVAPITPHHPSAVPPPPSASSFSRPSRLRGFSLLRRSGQNRSNPNSPPVSPPERLALERSTSYPLNTNTNSNNISNPGPAAVASNNSSDNVSEGGNSSSSSNDPSDPASTSAVAAGDLPNGSTAAAATTPAIPSSSQQPSSRGKFHSSTLAPESSSGMARLRRAFSSQNASQSTNVAVSSPAVTPAAPSTATMPASPPSMNNNATTPSTGNALADGAGRDGLAPDQMPTIKFIPHQDPRSSKPSLAFAATSRTLPHEDCVIRVGRYSERDGPQNPPPGVPSAAPVGFKSKVVSRKHCEFWCSQGQWYIKDIKSSSGTFLNHIRLSQPNQESRPFPINDGDVVQLGIDFKGGEEAIFRCVKIRIECNRNWQKKLNDFNMNTHKRLRELNKTASAGKEAPGQTNECSICLMSIAPCQSLFVAPCSHVWHFKCIRPMLNDHKTYPQFLCPNCRAVTDLEADIEEIEWNQEEDEHQDTDPEGQATASRTEEGQTTGADADVESSLSGSVELSSPPRADGGAGIETAVSTLELGDTSIDAASHGQTAPVEVPGASARPKTPGDGVSELMGNEGPLTPRNDAGPFVFDGSGANGPSSRPTIQGLAQSLDAGNQS